MEQNQGQADQKGNGSNIEKLLSYIAAGIFLILWFMAKKEGYKDMQLVSILLSFSFMLNGVILTLISINKSLKKLMF